MKGDPGVNAVHRSGDLGDDDPLKEMANTGGKAGMAKAGRNTKSMPIRKWK